MTKSLFKELDPNDFYMVGDKIVFTRNYHLKRGYCCKSGCKHCPYGYDKKTDSVKKIEKKPHKS